MEEGVRKTISSRVSDDLAEAVARRDSAKRDQILRDVREHNRTASLQERIIIDPDSVLQKVREIRNPKARRLRQARQFRPRGRELEELFQPTGPPRLPK